MSRRRRNEFIKWKANDNGTVYGRSRCLLRRKAPPPTYGENACVRVAPLKFVLTKRRSIKFLQNVIMSPSFNKWHSFRRPTINLIGYIFVLMSVEVQLIEKTSVSRKNLLRLGCLKELLIDCPTGMSSIPRLVFLITYLIRFGIQQWKLKVWSSNAEDPIIGSYQVTY